MASEAFFLQKFVDKVLQKHLLCISSEMPLPLYTVHCQCHFLSEHISRTAILTQAPVITCKCNFWSFSCITFTPIPRIPILIPRIPIIPTLIPCIFHHSPHSVLQFPITAFSDSLFPLHFTKLKLIVDLKFNLVL